MRDLPILVRRAPGIFYGAAALVILLAIWSGSGTSAADGDRE